MTLLLYFTKQTCQNPNERLMQYVINDNALNQVSQWYLKTKDAHKFYSKFGFNKLENVFRTTGTTEIPPTIKGVDNRELVLRKDLLFMIVI